MNLDNLTLAHGLLISFFWWVPVVILWAVLS